MQIPLTRHDKVRRSLLTRLEVRHGRIGIDLEDGVETEGIEEKAQGGTQSEGVEAAGDGVARDQSGSGIIIGVVEEGAVAVSVALAE